MDTKDQLEGAVAQVLQNAIESASKGAEFLKDQIPDVVQQLLRWKSAEAIFWASFEFLVLAVGAYVCVRFWRWCFREDVWDELGPIPAAPGALLIIPVWGILENISTVLQISVAPKVWLLEYATHLVKH